MDTLFQDLRAGFRMLVKSPGFTAVAVITLALGIGLNIAIFSLVDEFWLHPTPVRDADRLVRVYSSNPSSQGEIERGDSSYPDFEDLRTNAKTLSGVAALDRRGALFDDGTQSHLVLAGVVSNNFFDVLQVRPAAGRMFAEKEFQNSPALSVVLSYPFWRRQFNSDPSLAGRTIVLDSHPVMVLGILPRGFRGTEPMAVPDVWIPIATWEQLTGERYKQTDRKRSEYELFGMLQEHASLQQAKAELGTIAAQLAQAYPQSNTGRKMTLVPEDQTRGGMARIGVFLLGLAGLVLLIACANVASLLIARSEYRRKEIATRMALGAVPFQIVRQLLTETVMLAVAGGVAALVLGNLALHALPGLLPQMSVPLGVDAHLNLRGLLFAVITAALSLFLVGLVPALQAAHTAPVGALKQSGVQAGTERGTVRSALVIVQVALSLVMIVSAGLLVRSVVKALDIDPGFNAHQNMLMMELVPGFGTKTDQGSEAFVREARRRLEALPGVTATATGRHFPFGMSGSGATHKIFVLGSMSSTDREGATINFTTVGEGYFAVLGTRILRGRAVEQHDLDTNARVMVVNQRMASRFWPNQDPVGQRVRWNDNAEYQVIGVAEDGTYNEYGEKQMPYMFIPMDSGEYGELAMAVKTSVEPGALATAVRHTLRDINRDVPIISMLTLRDYVRESLYEQRVLAGLIAGMGGLGLLLAAVGIYGLMSFLVGRRTPEIGIRLALGAQRREIFRLVVKRAVVLTAIGAAIGVAGAVAATRLFQDLLFGVTATDVPTFLMAVVLLTAVACAAALFPALSATKVDPMVALRYE